MKRIDPSLLVILAGVSAALHIGKLPPALPVLRDALGITLLQGGFLLSLVQLAGMALGLAVGLAADGIGLKRTMVCGLLILSSASVLGGWAQGPADLLVLRAFEGLGFLLASMPAPGLIRSLVASARMSSALGLWGAYMPFGTALALLCGPVYMAWAGWRAWWWLLGGLSLAMAVWLLLALPSARPRVQMQEGWVRRLTQTLAAAGPWAVALSFAAYSAQWLAVIGFLPSIYQEAGLSAALAAPATALAAAVNIIGNVASGKLLQRSMRPQHLLYAGFGAMGIGGLLAFAPVWGTLAAPTVAWLRYGAVLLFSMLGGIIPGTLFSLAVRLAPSDRTVSTTVGWMQQWSAFGQFAGPPLVAVIATRAGGWHWSWGVTVACAVAGLGLAGLIGELLRRSHECAQDDIPTSARP